MSFGPKKPALPTTAQAVPGLAQVLLLVGDKLARVEAEILGNLRSEFGPIDEAGHYIGQAGGKRIRPALVLLTSGLLDYRGEDDVLLGAVFEFIHTATLVHDDIIDEATTRRGRASANSVFGNHFTVLLGDYLYIRSMNMALRARKLRLIDILAEATERMIEGEILGAHIRGRADITREQHLQIVERKTAWLFSACCRAAAVLSGADPRTEEDLAQFGMSLGVAFQLIDDLLDLSGEESTVGKPVASDLREGHLTLPWIDLLHRGSAAERAGVLQVLEDGAFHRVSFAELRAALIRHDCIEATRLLAEHHADQARRLVERFPASPYKDVLMEMPATVLSRDR